MKHLLAAPGPPVIAKVLTLTPGGSTEADVVVLWKVGDMTFNWVFVYTKVSIS